MDASVKEMMDEAKAAITDPVLATAFDAYHSVYAGEWGLKASEEDAVFAMLKAVWPDEFAKADFVETMRTPEMEAVMDDVYKVTVDEPWQGDADDAERFICDVLGIVYAQTRIKVGDRVRTKEWVCRYDFFEVAPDKTGTVTELSRQSLSVKMDEHIDGCEEWDNELVYVLPDDSFEVLATLEVVK